MFEEIVDADGAIIRVIGVGGAGGNALNNMVKAEIAGVEFICANTDAQALEKSSASTVIQIGAQTTRGLGAGAKPAVGRDSALEDRERIRELIEGTEMLFITAGMGGGTGTGAAPVVAEVAKEMGVLTVAVVTKPFAMEGEKRMESALNGIEELTKYVDSIITIPNEKLMSVFGPDMPLMEAFHEADGVLRGAVQGIAELITRDGMINVDFADVKTVMSEMGMAMMGTGTASGEDRAAIAADAALHSPLLDDVDLSGARGILVNVTSGYDLTMGQFQDVGTAVRKYASDDATIVIGAGFDTDMSGEIRVTVVATGLVDAEAASKEVEEPIITIVKGTGTDGIPMPIPTTDGKIDYDQPTIMRNNINGAQSQSSVAMGGSSDLNEDFFDVPAFLRAQAN
ncbi:MAG: cell division protein FtsZ [Thiotrichales bacterium]|jgi:cell division protein FtsZ|nr:cell division protein FtsZ [Thiotrichales bacterium]MBT3613675.1 cell division protein FtsZ [Thiotrichales bacterium]MBT3753190.1 cell division protein FtsZ [Thiotrichales bacterium]MBT3837740.1 cell division protein FtsZ [Thiotrichales bacterium]MBT4152426.1 cell division protein FtsZ [Thiotrichales bacterium]